MPPANFFLARADSGGSTDPTQPLRLEAHPRRRRHGVCAAQVPRRPVELTVEPVHHPRMDATFSSQRVPLNTLWYARGHWVQPAARCWPVFAPAGGARSLRGYTVVTLDGVAGRPTVDRGLASRLHLPGSRRACRTPPPLGPVLSLGRGRQPQQGANDELCSTSSRKPEAQPPTAFEDGGATSRKPEAQPPPALLILARETPIGDRDHFPPETKPIQTNPERLS